MTASEVLSSLEVALGGICSAPKILSAGKLLDLPVSGAIFERLLRHWASLPEGSRPKLRGVTLSRGTPPQRQLLLEISRRAPFMLVTVDSSWTAGTLTGVWPYAAWWEEELASFENISWAGGGNKSEVTWRRG